MPLGAAVFVDRHQERPPFAGGNASRGLGGSRHSGSRVPASPGRGEPSRGPATASGSASARSAAARRRRFLLAAAPCAGRRTRTRRSRSSSATAARRPLRHGARRARRRAAPLPARPSRRRSLARSDRAPAHLGRLRRRERARRRGAARRGSRTAGPRSSPRRRRGELDDALPRHLRAHVQPLPVHERALVPPPPARAGRRTPRPLGGMGGRVPWRSSPRSPTARSCSRARAPTCGASRRRPFSLRSPLIAFVAVVVLAIPLWRTYLVLASRFEVGLGSASGSKLGSPGRRRRLPAGTSLGDFAAAGLAARRRGRAARRPRSLARARPEPPSSPAARRAGRRADAARSGGGAVAGDAAPDLRPAVLRDARRGRPAVARRRRRPRRAAQRRPRARSPLGRGRLGLDRTPLAVRAASPQARGGAEDAAAWLAATSGRRRPLGYNPLFLEAVEEGAPSATWSSRAPTRSSRRDARGGAPSRSGAASGSTTPRTSAPAIAAPDRPAALPGPEFEVRAFGPFLVIWTLEPEAMPGRFLRRRCASSELRRARDRRRRTSTTSRRRSALKRLRAGDVAAARAASRSTSSR